MSSTSPPPAVPSVSRHEFVFVPQPCSSTQVLCRLFLRCNRFLVPLCALKRSVETLSYLTLLSSVTPDLCTDMGTLYDGGSCRAFSTSVRSSDGTRFLSVLSSREGGGGTKLIPKRLLLLNWISSSGATLMTRGSVPSLPRSII